MTFCIIHTYFLFPQLTGCSGLIDLAFAIDISGSIRQEHFDKVKEYIVQIIEKLEISDSKVRVAAITFEGQSRTVFGLNRYNTTHDVVQGILHIRWKGGRTNIQSALMRSQNQVKYVPSLEVHAQSSIMTVLSWV